MATMSANEHKSYVSLIRPLLHQVLENKLREEENDTENVKHLKIAIRSMLIDRYNNDERVALLLDNATYIDPRFKFLPHLSEEDRTRLGENVFGQIKDIVVQRVDDECDEESKANMSNIEQLLGTFVQNENKSNSAVTAKLEYQTYSAHPIIKLDHDPLEWWSKQTEKYPRLCHLAQKYMCVPSVTALPGIQTFEQLHVFNQKRSLLSSDVVDSILFLHVNASLN